MYMKIVKYKHMNKTLLVLVLVLVVGAGAYLYMKKYSAPAMQPTDSQQATSTPEAMSGAAGATTGAAKEFAVSGSEFAFSPATLSVAKGDTVKVTFTNTGKYPHNFTITDLNVQSKTVQAGESDTVTFTADKAGSFQYFCSVPSHKEKGMVGTLTVQ